MARRFMIAGNWKLHKTVEESLALARGVREGLARNDLDVLLAPTFPALYPVARELAGSPIRLGAQNLYWENQGAFTGEVSGPLIKAAGASHVIVGHSERRQYFGETEKTVALRLAAALAAGLAPVDLNNRFVGDPDPAGLVRAAEEEGLARTLCAWIKGIYAWCLAHPELATIVAVTQGDCSNTHALMELLTLAGRRVIPFDFPHGREPQALAAEIARLAGELGADLTRAEAVRRELAPLRRDLARLDELTWREGKVRGPENFLWLLTSSDFEGDWRAFHRRLRAFLAEADRRPPRRARLRLGLLGVPPIMSDLVERLEAQNAAVVYCEVPRQFAMLPPAGAADASLVDQYRRYTYPYDIFFRLEDIAAEAARRKLDGLIHYTQSFCFRQMQDLVIRQRLRLPVLTLEGDRVGPVDPRTALRLEAFLDLIR